MTDIREQVTVARPRSDVAAYMFDPSNDAEWTTGVLEARPRQPGRLRAGSKVARTVSFLGRKFGYEYEVLAADGDEFVEMTVDRPFPMHIRYELTDGGDATRAAIHATGDAGGFFKLAGPLLDPMVRRNIRGDLAALKEILERHDNDYPQRTRSAQRGGGKPPSVPSSRRPLCSLCSLWFIRRRRAELHVEDVERA